MEQEPYDDGVLPILATIQELDNLCPQLGLKSNATRQWLRVVYGSTSVDSDVRLRAPTLHRHSYLGTHTATNSRNDSTIALPLHLGSDPFEADYDGDEL